MCEKIMKGSAGGRERGGEGGGGCRVKKEKSRLQVP